MKFKSENGFTLTDITVAIIIVLSFMSLIAIIFFNISKSSTEIERESQATYLATSVIEDIKSKEYMDIALTNEEWINAKNYEFLNDEKIKEIMPDGYTCTIFIKNHVPENKTTNTDLVKLIKVKVEYKFGGEIKEVLLTTTVVKNI